MALRRKATAFVVEQAAQLVNAGVLSTGLPVSTAGA